MLCIVSDNMGSFNVDYCKHRKSLLFRSNIINKVRNFVVFHFTEIFFMSVCIMDLFIYVSN